jgi:hypothetical protein
MLALGNADETERDRQDRQQSAGGKDQDRIGAAGGDGAGRVA